MCGIAGCVTPRCTDALALRNLATQMCGAMPWRGPDSSGTWVEPSAGLALGHLRLAIVDLSEHGHQPMESQSGRFVIVANGEIYNFKDLRKDLETCGYRFRGHSDIEVLVNAIEEWGVERALKACVGMYAFAVWDKKERTLTLARDRMGEKPLYYGYSRGSFLFGSVLAPITAHPDWEGIIDRDALGLYFQTNYIPQPHSIYKGVSKLAPASYVRLSLEDLERQITPTPFCYWNYEDVQTRALEKPFGGSDTEAISQLTSLLEQSVRGQMLADVPLGAFLSGGVDSSIVVATMAKLSSAPVHTYTIGFDDVAYDEAPFAREIANHLGTQHTELYVSPAEAQAVIPNLPWMYDEPFADSSQIPTHLVSRLARKSVTVTLSGDGGDELFCGYNRHVELLKLYSKFAPIPMPLRKGAARLIEATPSSVFETVLRRKKRGVLADQVQKVAAILPKSDIEAMYQELTTFWPASANIVIGASHTSCLRGDSGLWPDFSHPLRKIMFVELMTSLTDDMMAKVDRAAMSVSLESRVPLLDHRIIEFAATLPRHMLVREGSTKWLLRQVLYQSVPKELIERPKSGFGIPIDDWLRGPLRDWAESLLSADRLKSEGYLRPGPIRQKWAEHLSGRGKWQPHLWSVLMFQSWLEHQNSDPTRTSEACAV